MCACTWRPKVATSCLTFFETGSLLHVQLTDCLVWLADLMPVPRTGVTNAHYCPPFFNVATRDLNSGSHACMAKSSLSPAPSWLVVGDRSPYAALEGLTLESGMASTSSSPAFGLCSPEIPRFLPHCLPPFHWDAISRRVSYLSSSSSLQFRWFLPFIKYWGGV